MIVMVIVFIILVLVPTNKVVSVFTVARVIKQLLFITAVHELYNCTNTRIKCQRDQSLCTSCFVFIARFTCIFRLFHAARYSLIAGGKGRATLLANSSQPVSSSFS